MLPNVTPLIRISHLVPSLYECSAIAVLFHHRHLVLWLISSITLGIVLPGMTLHTTFGFLLYVYAPLLLTLSIVPPSASCGPICVTGFCTLRDFLHFACHIWFLPLWLLFSQLFLPQPPVCCGSILVLPWIVPNIASYRIRVYPLRMLFSTLFHDSFCASPWVFVPHVSLPLFTFGFLPLVAGVPLSCNSCKFLWFLQIPAIPANSCKFLQKFLQIPAFCCGCRNPA